MMIALRPRRSPLQKTDSNACGELRSSVAFWRRIHVYLFEIWTKRHDQSCGEQHKSVMEYRIIRRSIRGFRVAVRAMDCRIGSTLFRRRARLFTPFAPGKGPRTSVMRSSCLRVETHFVRGLPFPTSRAGTRPLIRAVKQC
jgi:hypothetical protein